MHRSLGATLARDHSIVGLIVQTFLGELKLKLQLLSQLLKRLYAVMLVLNKLNVLNLKIALLAG